MGWQKRESVSSNLVTLGDDEGHVGKVGGLLASVRQDPNPKYKNPVYELVQKDGSSVLLAGSASLSRQIFETDVGKFLRAEFVKWGQSPNGKFKEISVNIWEGEPNDAMKAWPRFKEFQGRINGPTPTVQKQAEKVRDDFDDFASPPPQLAQGDDDSDLPF
jgi:hypothetical protein